MKDSGKTPEASGEEVDGGVGYVPLYVHLFALLAVGALAAPLIGCPLAVAESYLDLGLVKGDPPATFFGCWLIGLLAPCLDYVGLLLLRMHGPCSREDYLQATFRRNPRIWQVAYPAVVTLLLLGVVLAIVFTVLFFVVHGPMRLG